MRLRNQHLRRVAVIGASVAAASAVAMSPGTGVAANAQPSRDSAPHLSACGGGGAYSPQQVQQAYDMMPLYASGYAGRGTTIAIVDSYGSPTIKSDLRHFDAACGLPDPPSFRVITPVGKPPRFNPASSDMSGWAGETTLDVEWAHAMAPQAKILLVETPVSETEGVHGFPQIVAAENYVLRHNLADVISQSFGATEQTFPGAHSIESLRSAFINAQRDGVTVLAASGDAGATDYKLDGSTLYNHRVTSWPASDPLVTAVGGTEISLDSQGFRVAPDVVWHNAFGAGGGGMSTVFGRPGYQDSVAKVTGAHRGVPDISLNAGAGLSVWATYPGAGGWGAEAGTSAATPVFAGIVAAADQIAGHRLGLINPSLYQLARQSDGGIVDVTRGNNSFGGVIGFRATAGYDLASGLGSVDANLLARRLAARSRSGPALG